MIPIPIRDERPSSRFPAVVFALVALNSLVWLLELAHGIDLSLLDYGAIPAWVLHGTRDGTLKLPGAGAIDLHQEVPPPLTIFTSMFLHGGWLHLIGNMWFLWIFGDNVEDVLGHGRFLVFYLFCGALAAVAQICSAPDAAVPMVGASGAIAGALGGYARLFPRDKVRCLWILIIFVTFVDVPAWLLLALWFLSQWLLPAGSGVAAVAHVAGFAAGFLLIRLFQPRAPAARHGWPSPSFARPEG